MFIPFFLTIVFTLAGLVLAIVMAWAAWRHRRVPPLSDAEASAGAQATNRWIVGLRVLFVLLIFTVLGFHSYWVFKADNTEQFRRAKQQDARNHRLAEMALKGWVLDRTGKLENALIRYRNDGGVITREYPLGAAAVHLTGYSDFVFGSGGIEQACSDLLLAPTSFRNRIISPFPVGKDLKLSIDAGLQREVFQLAASTGKPTAAVVLLLPNNEVLAMASTPSFDPLTVTDEVSWRQLTDQADEAPHLSPIVNRVLGTTVTGQEAFYYRPGSTFKIFVAAAAIDSSITGERFSCTAEGFLPPGSARPIRDFGGEVHGTIGLVDAFKHSCNQYFAQLGLKLGRQRLANYARRLGYVVSPGDQASISGFWNVSHGEPRRFNDVFAPPTPRMNLSPKATPFDVALQSFGQGFDDLTVMSMAIMAAAVASEDGQLVAPTLEPGTERKIVGPFIRDDTAKQLRELMRLVVHGGTASGAFAPLAGRITSGGKTGTADRELPIYDRFGHPVIDYVDSDGRQHFKFHGVTDSWFVGFAPAENPQIVFAVMVENGGQGAKAAAPLSVKIIEKAAARGYLKPTHLMTRTEKSSP